jgi:hypothetical protein
MDLTAHVPKDILDLLSAFLSNRRADIKNLRTALAKGDWERLQHIAECLYALGNPYGFRQISTFGRFMRETCAAKDSTALERLIKEYETYLSTVNVVQVDAPAIREVFSPELRERFVAAGAPTMRRQPNSRT